MALLTVCFRAAALAHDTAVNIILPEGCPDEDIPTVFLLHGMSGDHSSWVRKTCIERYAAERRLAIVMPEGENSFYADMKYGKNFYTYVSEELVDYVRRILRLSRKRERTFICGLSMGGYGAFKLALRKPEQYAAAASLSGCLDICERLSECSWQREAAAIWGDDFAVSVRGSDDDLLALLRRYDGTESLRPRLYAACGTEDSLYGSNLTFAEAAKKTDLELRFEPSPGIHNWVFWDRTVVPALDFFLEGKLK